MNQLLTRDGIIMRLHGTGKKAVLQALCEKMAALTGQHDRSIFDAIREREQLGSTGVGKGIAIPHARVAGLDKVYAVFAQLAEPINFDAVDGQPVDLVVMLLAPSDAGADHLKALATVSRTFRDAALCQRLRNAPNAEVLYQLLTEADIVLAA